MKLLQESPVEILEPLLQPPESVYVAQVKGPLGSVSVAGKSKGIIRARINVSLRQFIHDLKIEWGTNSIVDNVPLNDTLDRLTAFLHGIPGAVEATAQPVMITHFTLQVHRYLVRIPYGQTVTYGEIASALGNPNASRAVGSACGRNRVAIIIPCHRVLSAGGLGGFGAGLDVKKKLLRLEGISI